MYCPFLVVLEVSYIYVENRHMCHSAYACVRSSCGSGAYRRVHLVAVKRREEFWGASE